MDSLYDTQLSPEEEQRFQAWAKAGRKDPEKESYDYDLRGYFKATNEAPLGEGHLTDQFKKPNHPTFSTESQYHGRDGHEGGTWGQLPSGAYTFTPGRSNLEHFGPEGLDQYFQKFEPGNQLMLPRSQ